MNDGGEPAVDPSIAPAVALAMTLDAKRGTADAKRGTARLRLYIARSTPNSIRAEQNLQVAMKEIDDGKRFALEIVDVFTHPRRAITDGVMVTPTLIGMATSLRLTMIGDLADSAKLNLFLQSLSNASKLGE